MQSRDIDQVALVARLQRDAGTNAAEVIDQVSENVRGRMDLERLVRTLTAQGRMARWIVSAAAGLPVRRHVRAEPRVPGAALGDAARQGRPGARRDHDRAGSFVIKKIVEIEV